MREKAALVTVLAAAAVILGGATVAVAASSRAGGDQDLGRIGVNVDRSSQLSTTTGSGQDDDDDTNLAPLNTADRDQAANAALARVGQGTVAEVERENDGNVAYEVEVRLDNGSQVEVGLGADFAVLNQAAPEFDDD